VAIGEVYEGICRKWLLRDERFRIRLLLSLLRSSISKVRLPEEPLLPLTNILPLPCQLRASCAPLTILAPVRSVPRRARHHPRLYFFSPPPFLSSIALPLRLKALLSEVRACALLFPHFPPRSVAASARPTISFRSSHSRCLLAGGITSVLLLLLLLVHWPHSRPLCVFVVLVLCSMHTF
jgi:hypothetical protein